MVPPIDPPASLADDLFPDPVPLDVAHEEEVASAAEPPPLQNPFAHLSTALGFDDISGDASPMKPRTSSRTVSDDGMSENDEEPVDVGGTSSGDDRSEETQVFARDLDGGSRDDSQESTGSYDDDEGTGQEQVSSPISTWVLRALSDATATVPPFPSSAEPELLRRRRGRAKQWKNESDAGRPGATDDALDADEVERGRLHVDDGVKSLVSLRPCPVLRLPAFFHCLAIV